MLIAKEKKASNIAEYILYMWQLEDILRALNLDVVNVKEHIIAKYDLDTAVAQEMYDWYDNLIEMMKKERVEKKGHMQILKNNVDELTELHYYLLHKAHDSRYRQIVTMAAANLADLRQKSAASEEVSDVELALNGLYGHLMLKLQQKEITSATSQAMETFSKMIAYLAAKYKISEEQLRAE
ncbi:DUF4924 family protein [Porphyromonadaceae bacterium OttesenSCG-928-L07]|nr:DUF4924 family protein [Porphyromonadaceae bacterium OttesenSCG-928-L07]MDL2252088.1 DUF4924 family protein [Odoribacter sp. OttesenSCG-928-J03]MDL2330835.1 DUF4924 family protein [Odoribacter sp. OttesenSCG-928-A06]